PRVKRENEFAVGLVVIAAFAVVVGGALWLSGAHIGRTEAVYTARFRTVGGLNVGDPVVLRGVRVGRVEGIRLASGNWVEADLKIYAGTRPPSHPAVRPAAADVIGSVGTNLREGSQAVAKAATQVQATLGRVDSATNKGQLATILNNSAEASSNMRSASQDFRDLLDAAHKNQESLVRVLVSADSVMSRIANRSGTLGLLVSDSTLYRETTLTMIQLRQLLSDIQANPRKYFSFSVF